jgi:hypothetical protein
MEGLFQMARLSRKNFIVNKKFQYQIVGVSLLFSIPIVIIFLIGHIVFVNSLFDFVSTLDADTSKSFYNFISNKSFKLKSIIGFSVFMILVINLFFFFMLSHSIAGPIEKIKNLLELKIKGEPIQSIDFRESDFFSELAPLINKSFGLTQNIKLANQFKKPKKE